MMRLFFDTSYHVKTQRVVSRIEKEGPFRKVVFKNNMIMYYPMAVPLSSLERVVCECFYNTNWHYYEVPQTRVEANDVVVDCGAAEGLFSLLVASRCKKVYAIEPLQNFYNCLQKTFAEYSNVHVLHLGVSDEEGYATISENDIASSLSMGSGEVEVSTLDKLFFEKDIPVTYIKIDVEGFDLKVLQGAKKLIEKYKPKIAVTTYHKAEHAVQIKDFLLSIVPDYNLLTKGIYQETGSPVMLHAWHNHAL
jgi:FkbM family methyltransferase